MLSVYCENSASSQVLNSDPAILQMFALGEVSNTTAFQVYHAPSQRTTVPLAAWYSSMLSSDPKRLAANLAPMVDIFISFKV